MVIVHIAPFAPTLCGLYEHARDMARADIEGGNQVIFIDAGVSINGVRQEGKINAVDDRAGFKLETAHPDMIMQADVIIQHTGCNDIWTVKTQAPIFWVIHGRPLACFRPETTGKANSYSLYSDLSKWPRAKKMIYFWPEFKEHWNVCIDESKHLIFDYPVVDENRFNNIGNVHTLENPGKYNFLICDSAREDVDLYETVVGCIESAKKFPNQFKFHFYGFDHPIPNCWSIVFDKLKSLGALGDLKARVNGMESIYKTCDCLISPNKIITRTIAESLCCGTPVIAQQPCKISDITCEFSDVNDFVEAITIFKNKFDNKEFDKQKIIERSKVFNMKNYYTRMNEVYKEVLA